MVTDRKLREILKGFEIRSTKINMWNQDRRNKSEEIRELEREN